MTVPGVTTRMMSRFHKTLGLGRVFHLLTDATL